MQSRLAAHVGISSTQRVYVYTYLFRYSFFEAKFPRLPISVPQGLLHYWPTDPVLLKPHSFNIHGPRCSTRNSDRVSAVQVCFCPSLRNRTLTTPLPHQLLRRRSQMADQVHHYLDFHPCGFRSILCAISHSCADVVVTRRVRRYGGFGYPDVRARY